MNEERNLKKVGILIGAGIIFIGIICQIKLMKESHQSQLRDFSNIAIEEVLKHEGVYSNDVDDEGGETKYGISKVHYPKLDIKNLTLEKAKEIYKKDFWVNQHYDEIKDEKIVIKLFDLSVNIGIFWAHRLIQRALRACGEKIEEDGALGVKTLAAINKVDPTDLLAALKSEAAGYYRTLNAINSKRAKFLKGWLERAYGN